MRQTTNQEKLENIVQALAMLDDIPESKIIRNLWDWTNAEFRKDPNHCGAAACFGGWVAVHPFFQERYDIHPSNGRGMAYEGQLRTRRVYNMQDMSNRLFGVDDAFSPNYDKHSNGTRVKDKTVIRRRLQRAFKAIKAK